jgi:hypothetical protein
MASIARRPDGTYRPRYRDEHGKEHARHFKRKVDAQRWLDEVTAAVQTGTYVDPGRAKLTVGSWPTSGSPARSTSSPPHGPATPTCCGLTCCRAGATCR